MATPAPAFGPTPEGQTVTADAPPPARKAAGGLRNVVRQLTDADGSEADSDDGDSGYRGDSLSTGADAGPGGSSTPPATKKVANSDSTKDEATRAQLKPALVVEGYLTWRVDEVPEAASAIGAYIDGVGGRVTREELYGGERSWTGHLQVKLPPERVDEFLAWLGERGDIENKHISGTDVSRTLFDQKIALDNLQLTLNRMRKLLDNPNLDIEDVLSIERELTRLRGEIERIKGQKRFLEYRVAMATLDIHLRRKKGAIPDRQRAKFYPGVRLSSLFLLDPDGRQRARLGGGVDLHILPRLSVAVDVFPEVNDEGAAVVITYGFAVFSDFLGRGKRRYLNPYLGARLGYGYLDGSAFVFSAGGGVELFKNKYTVLDLGVSYQGFVRATYDAALTSHLSAVFSF